MTALQLLDHDDCFAAACSLWQLCNSLIMMKALKQLDHDDCFKTAWSWWQLCSCLIMMTAFNSWMMMTASQQRGHNDSLATAWSWWQLCNKLNMMTALQQIDHNDSFAVACHHDQAVVNQSPFYCNSLMTTLQQNDDCLENWKITCWKCDTILVIQLECCMSEFFYVCYFLIIMHDDHFDHRLFIIIL